MRLPLPSVLSPARPWLLSALLVPMLMLPGPGAAAEPPPAAALCAPDQPPGQWLAPTAAAPRPLPAAELLGWMAEAQVVLLGERHDSAEDHRWQLQVLAQLHARRPALALGLEMFPRRLQPVLDAWVAGRLSEAEFLRQSEWDQVWGFDARLYLPLFHFARMNRLPMLALNVERGVVAAVGRRGFEALSEAEREGVGRPAEPPEAYRQMLRQVFHAHPGPAGEGGAAQPSPTAPDAPPPDAFARFIGAQAFWDRAMAEAIAARLAREPGLLIVGILGGGHVRDGHGVAHQLRDLGVPRIGALLTWERAESCQALGETLADGLYLIDPPRDDAPPRLGIAMAPAPDGVRLSAVTPGSLAAAAGLREGDLLTEAAGRPLRSPDALRALVQRQPPGTWLPLKVQREGAGRAPVVQEVVVRFPAGG
ncbi:hypothetical protein X805_29000 [Sphaerotilus natans subsp. natans DSM 6575]|uniref:PDZ domain-containing protein n=1 Tax=Sphaerotilus natans subsp. natans DSM 6575 TaxID=1286631 RepID=A0A059KJA9_9BURK|nr:ChaN family lipoprotein [Sphaerotilus natans]KDB51522.1 hypothetical protein X805_29000 [Sphaerotilus natans subsp. natans DSM 6575]SIR43391.1 PDZ domain-containing protein [Sphaerotilus natans]